MNEPVFKVVQERLHGYRSICAEGRYRLDYTHGKITNAYPGSMGVMCFKRKKEAIDLCDSFGAKIIMVKGIGECREATHFIGRFTEDHIESVCEALGEHGWDKMFLTTFYCGRSIHFGTICYDSVMVL